MMTKRDFRKEHVQTGALNRLSRVRGYLLVGACGSVMRVSMAGFAGFAEPFRLGCELGSITHGHPTEYLVTDLARGNDGSEDFF